MIDSQLTSVLLCASLIYQTKILKVDSILLFNSLVSLQHRNFNTALLPYRPYSYNIAYVSREQAYCNSFRSILRNKCCFHATFIDNLVLYTEQCVLTFLLRRGGILSERKGCYKQRLCFPRVANLTLASSHAER